MTDEMSAAAYRKSLGLDDEHDIYEMSSEQFNREVRGMATKAMLLCDVVEPPAKGKKQHVKPKAQVEFEAWLERMTNERGIPMLREYRGIPGRQFKFDYAIPAIKLAIEYDGLNIQGADKSSGHRSIEGVMKDAEKINLAQMAGWMVIRVNAATLNRKNGAVGYEHVGLAFAARRSPLPDGWEVVRA